MTNTTMPDRICLQIGLTAENFTGFALRKWSTETFSGGTEYVRADLATQAAGIENAARYIERLRDDYIAEYGSYDGETGMTEFPGNGEEYLGGLEEIIEGIRALAVSAENGGRNDG